MERICDAETRSIDFQTGVADVSSQIDNLLLVVQIEGEGISNRNVRLAKKHVNQKTNPLLTAWVLLLKQFRW